MKPFFSIIIPTLNEEKYIHNFLKNLQSQKEKDFEVIVVDGCSQDETKKMVLSFNKILPIRFFLVKKRKVAYQRNYGAKDAKGDYLIFLDADCGINNCFTKNLKKIILTEKGLVFIPYVYPDEDDSQMKVIFNFINFFVELSQILGRPISSGGSLIVEKNFFNLIGGFPENVYLAEDHQFIDKAYQWGVGAKFLRKIKVKFSLRRIKREGRLKAFYKCILATAQFITKGKIDKKIFEYKMGGHLYSHKIKESGNNEVFKKYLNQIKIFFKKLSNLT